ncbi:hypothetical protein SUGI_0137100 [Cryptomeria japonica]|nr:hypothetical protein SUGI_0137100 [Cryptomeria japonica]
MEDFNGRRGIWRIKLGSRGKGGLRRRLHVSRPRLRILCIVEKMKKVNNCFLLWVASAGKKRLGAFVGAKNPACVTVATSTAAPRPCYGRSNSFYAAAIADCIDFIKVSSSRGTSNHG